MRKEDHSVVEDVVWGETIFSDTYGFPILKNLQAIQAEQICRTPDELKAVRDNYEKRMKEMKKQSGEAYRAYTIISSPISSEPRGK